jgi:sulfotransferase family protein
MSSPTETLKGPDFFIVGAPKCGTTAMTADLGQHPEIGMCPRKETHHFATDLYERLAVKRGQRPPDRRRFLDLFAELQDYPRRGEASVWHLYSAAAASEIKSFHAEASVLVMLRNPVEMLPSLHSQFVYVGLEPVEDFEAALALDAERERSGTPVGFPPSSYRSAIRYSEQLRRYIDVFGRDRVHVIRYEDFRADTRATYRHACEFLGVDPGFEPEIEVINPNKQVRSRLLRRVVRRPPESLRPILHRVTTEAMRRRVGNEMNRLNTKFTRRAPTPDAVSLGIRPDVERQVHELDELLDLDVSSWLD